MDTKDKEGDRSNDTARACADALELLNGGYITREDLTDLTVKDARDICGQAKANMERIDALGKFGNRPHNEIRQTKEYVGRAVSETARQTRAGSIAKKDVRAAVDVNSYRFA